MNEYINKEDLVKAIEADFNKDWGERGANGDWDYIDGARDEYDDVINIICQMPAADVQSVVHCKDCKHRKERHYEESGEKPYIKYECKFTKYSMSDDGFCSFGLRMDGDTNG